MLLLLSFQARGGGVYITMSLHEEWMLIIAEIFTVRKAAQNDIVIHVKMIIESAV